MISIRGKLDEDVTKDALRALRSPRLPLNEGLLAMAFALNRHWTT